MGDAIRTYDLVSRDAKIALTEFSEDFMMALSQDDVEQWAWQLGKSKISKALETKFPVPVSTAGYEKFKGNPRYRSIFEKSVSVKPDIWQDGVAELARIVEAPDFVGFDAEPTKMAQAAQSLKNRIIAQLLEGGTSGTHEFDGVAFFSASHPVNIFDTNLGVFINNYTGGSTVPGAAILKQAKERLRKRKAANGEPLGTRLTHILAPPALEEDWKDLLENDLLIETVGSSFGAVNNRHKGTVKLIIADELTSDTAWYALALNKPGLMPWGLQATSEAPELLILDKSSALYEQKKKVGVDGTFEVGGALLLPHAIDRYAGA